MLEPTGPLPPEIYWRRRVFAIGALVLVLAVVVWLVVMVARGGGTPGSTGAAATSTTAAPRSTGPSSTASASGASVTTATAVAAAPCTDQSLAVKVTVDKPTYRSGEQPIFGIVITNISAAACSRDVGSGLQQISVQSLDGQRRLWASTDCYPDGQADVRTLNRGEQAAFQVTWSGFTSQPKCAGERVPVPAGGYTVMAQLGAVRSAAEPFNIA